MNELYTIKCFVENLQKEKEEFWDSYRRRAVDMLTETIKNRLVKTEKPFEIPNSYGKEDFYVKLEDFQVVGISKEEQKGWMKTRDLLDFGARVWDMLNRMSDIELSYTTLLLLSQETK